MILWWSIENLFHDNVIKWKHFPRYWPFVREIHRSPVNSPHRGQWRGALMFSLIWVWMNGWVNNREFGDLRRYRAHHDVTVMNLGTATAIQYMKYSSQLSSLHGVICRASLHRPHLPHVNLIRHGQSAHVAINVGNKYSLLMHCIKIKSRAKSLLNEQYVFVGGNISFLCMLSCISEEA